MKRIICSALLVANLAACGSGYTILDTSSLTISANARISAQTMLPDASKYPEVVQKLALAEEVYERQLYLLKERRNKLRSRRRYLSAFSFGTYTATTLGVGLTAIGTSDEDSSRNLEMAGAAALGGLALGTLFQVASYMQEDVEAVDGKVAQLDLLHNEMIDTLRVLGDRKVSAQLNEQGEVSSVVSSSDFQFEMSRVIQDFINKAKLINVKG
jgi:hypothetical protein